MIKTRHFIAPMVLTALLSSCYGTGGKEQQSLAEISKQELATALEERDELLALVKDVSAGLEEIKQLENMMAAAATRPADSPHQKKQILTDIARLKNKISRRKAHLKELEEKLQKSTINNKDLTETVRAFGMQMDSQMDEIESLRLELTAASEQIGVLNEAVDSLNSTVSAVTDERDSARQTSVRLANELNICYYVIATKSQLKDYNILKSGFLRSTKLMKGDFDKNGFTIGDKRLIPALATGSSKAKILTNHPEESYEFIDDNGHKTLRIIDPAAFWSLTNYLVIQTD